MDVFDFGAREKFFDGRIYSAVFHIFLGYKSPAWSIRVERARAIFQLSGKTRVFRIALAGLRVDVHRTGERQLLHAFERIVSKEQGLLASRNYS